MGPIGMYDMKRIMAFAAGLTLACICSSVSAQETTGVPEIRREARGVWVATVANIDWPSRPGLPVEQQQQEIREILDRCVELNLNQVVYQVRPACDALYQSDLEPWSEYLTGEQGKAPEPFYDPLTMWVEESHKRGIELHCWFNPYRARLLGKEKPTADNHISKTNPDVVKTYGNYQWMDPGEEFVQQRSLDVMIDVVKRYNIDGVHMDDYFYPYPIIAKDDKGEEIVVDGKKQELDFPDEPSWKKYKDGGGTLKRNDWRRQNVDQFVERLYKAVKAEKPYVKLGISPFGIWRPGNPPQIEGLDQYDKLYADAKLWLEEGWVDYWTPQLYWPVSKPQQSFPVLLKWWVEQNKKDRHIWPGLFTGKFADTGASWGKDELQHQIEWTRLQEGASGNTHFSMKAFMRNAGGMNDLLLKNVYKQKALVPAFTWIDKKAPAKPSTPVVEDDPTSPGKIVSWSSDDSKEQAFVWAVYTGIHNEKGKTSWRTTVKAAGETSMTLAADDLTTGGATVLVSAVDRNGNESPRAQVKIPAMKAADGTGTASADQQ